MGATMADRATLPGHRLRNILYTASRPISVSASVNRGFRKGLAIRFGNVLSLVARYNSSIVSVATVEGRYTPLLAGQYLATTGPAQWVEVTRELTHTAFAETKKTGWAVSDGGSGRGRIAH
jgi:hypothetical protein